MSATFQGWPDVCRRLLDRADAGGTRLNEGQRRALAGIADRFAGGQGNLTRGVIIADEVGMGKTRVASAVARSVADAGGRVAILVPPGLHFQWRAELAGDDLELPALVHTLGSFLCGPDADSWLTAPVLLISHGFANWRMRGSTSAPRWGLLPALVARHVKETKGRWPNFYLEAQGDFGESVVARATTVYKHIVGTSWADPLAQLDRLLENMDVWRTQYCCRPEYYSVDGPNREPLERAVGWGLSRFDLIIVDEAHKARGAESGLSRLLDRMVNRSDAPAYLALTATPLALDISEWSGTLERAGATRPVLTPLRERIEGYGKATETLRGRWRTDEASRSGWISSAATYQAALRPYVVRRDKSEDHHVRKFAMGNSREPEYRRTTATLLSSDDLSPAWRQVVLASEALSAATSGADDLAGKRLRLTLANGHGVASMIARVEAPKDELRDDDGDVARPGDGKRAARVAFWRGLVRAKAGEGSTAETALFRHPQILRAVKLIEEELGGEKVLVFGRFTAPLEALCALLNARAKLSSVSRTSSVPWPAESLGLSGQDGEGAVVVPSGVDLLAAEQLGISPLRFAELEAQHAERVRTFESRRAWFRRNVGALLQRAAGLRDLRPGLLSLLRAAAASSPGTADDADAPLARALWEMMHETDRQLLLDERDSPDLINAVVRGFRDLVAASTDQDSFDEAEARDDEAATATWDEVRRIIADEFSRTRGSFARLLDGGTKYPTRRLLQAAFNRQNSFPRVLVAQSIVGREGLNLHEACRVVLLLHPEWNPGVVEQQIGRVDRLGSHWATALDAALAAGKPSEEWPRIEVHSIIFGGTYDEHQWGVLNRRWADLRAQLHGVVIPPGEVGDEPEHRRIAEELNAAAPRFAP